MIISERQKAAARLNGAKSRGPKTEAGKRRSSRNGCKHNLYSRTRSPLAPGESPDDFARLLEELRAMYQPQTPRAESALHILAANTWLQNRVRATTTSLMNAEIDRLTPLHPGADFDTLAFLAIERVPVIDLLGRCESRYERRINRAEDILDKERTKAQAAVKLLKTKSRTREPFAFNAETAQNPEPETPAAPPEPLSTLQPNVLDPSATAAPAINPAESSKTRFQTRRPFPFNTKTARNPEPKPRRTAAAHAGIPPQRTRNRCRARTAARPANTRRVRNGQPG